jgi:hypothetical protein
MRMGSRAGKFIRVFFQQLLHSQRPQRADGLWPLLAPRLDGLGRSGNEMRCGAYKPSH